MVLWSDSGPDDERTETGHDLTDRQIELLRLVEGSADSVAAVDRLRRLHIISENHPDVRFQPEDFTAVRGFILRTLAAPGTHWTPSRSAPTVVAHDEPTQGGISVTTPDPTPGPALTGEQERIRNLVDARAATDTLQARLAALVAIGTDPDVDAGSLADRNVVRGFLFSQYSGVASWRDPDSHADHPLGPPQPGTWRGPEPLRFSRTVLR